MGAESTLAQIMRVVMDAQLRKPHIQAFADKLSGYFVPIVLMLSLLTWFTWSMADLAGAGTINERKTISMGSITVENGQLLAFIFGISVLVIACPCALGLATPTAIMVGGGVGAAQGILLKGGDVIEAAARLKAIAFDKTGTLTTGVLSVTSSSVWDEALDETTLVRLAGSAERGSEHPISKAIVGHAEARAVPTREPEAFVAVAGQGIQCVVDGKVVYVGNRRFMAQYALALTAEREAEVARLEGQGHTCVFVATAQPARGDDEHDAPDRDGERRDGEQTPRKTPGETLDKTHDATPEQPALKAGAETPTIAGMFAVADTLKPEAPAVIAELRRRGFEPWMISGDNERTAGHIAAQAGIAPECVAASMLPVGKLDKVRELQRLHGKIAFVGDGVNDAPALASADVGIAVGSGTDVAIESADIVLMKSSLFDVLTALHLSRVVMSRIRLNFVWAFGYNLVGIPLAAGLLYPTLGLQFPPMFAGAAMALSSVSVVCSSLLLRLYKPPMTARSHAMSLGAKLTRAATPPPGDAIRVDIKPHPVEAQVDHV